MVLLRVIRYLQLRYYRVVTSYTMLKITLLWCCYMLYGIYNYVTMVLLHVIRYLKLRYYGVILYIKVRYYGDVTCYMVFKIALQWCFYMLYCS